MPHMQSNINGIHHQHIMELHLHAYESSSQCPRFKHFYLIGAQFLFRILSTLTRQKIENVQILGSKTAK